MCHKCVYWSEHDSILKLTMNDQNFYAVAAFTISAISLTISLLAYLRDKPKMKVTVFKNAFFKGAGSTRYISVIMTNVGRRPLTAHLIGIRNMWDFKETLVFPGAKGLPQKLNEGEDVTCIFPRTILENESWKGVAYVLATDNTGKEYKKNIAPFYRVWPYRIVYWLSIPIQRLRSTKRRSDDD